MVAAWFCIMLDLVLAISIRARVAIVLAEGLAGGGLMRSAGGATLLGAGAAWGGGGEAITESA